VIELSGIGRDYEVGGRPVHALVGIDLEIPDGDYLSVMGPSGSGKSTLLNVLGCLDHPTAGSYRLDGKEVASLDEEALTQIRRHRIGFVFQTYHLVPRLTAAGNVELPMVFAGVERRERARRVNEALAAVGLSGRADHGAEQLSGGERQRVAIARAIVMGPELLLADEPTGNLDTKSADAVFELMRRVNREQGTTILFVTHNGELARRCDRTIQVIDGRVVVPALTGS